MSRLGLRKREIEQMYLGEYIAYYCAYIALLTPKNEKEEPKDKTIARLSEL